MEKDYIGLSRAFHRIDSQMPIAIWIVNRGQDAVEAAHDVRRISARAAKI
jgi:hypothetical protein